MTWEIDPPPAAVWPGMKASPTTTPTPTPTVPPLPPNCTSFDVSTFKIALKKVATECEAITLYDWGGLKVPTDTQYSDICKCESTVERPTVPDCTIQKISVADENKFLRMTLNDFYLKVTVHQCAIPKDYPLCTVSDINVFTSALNTASNGCTGSSSFNWGGISDPTEAQYAELCKCNVLRQSDIIPQCSVQKEFFKHSMDFVVTSILDLQCPTYSPPPSLNNNSVPIAPASGSRSGSGSSSGVAASSSSSKVGMLAGIVGGIVAVVLVVGLVVYKRNRKSREVPRDNQDASISIMHSPVGSYQPISMSPGNKGTNYTDPRASSQFDGSSTTTRTSTAESSAIASGTGGRGNRDTKHNIRNNNSYSSWDDPAIISARIPRDTIFFGPLISRGGYGEVFRGTYMGEAVAIKQLIPARRKDLKQIDDFLGEVKLMSGLEHERIVRFVGVAWNSLSDACMVVEYMENGDLRSVLTRWNEGMEQRSTGFDADKIKIALHVAHALTYLHSLKPPVVHRDLKSKNILLDANLDAKVADFGISRERVDATMTAGVGSSLWMAPEVMMGERYDEKADVFSFGVVLSELDTHELPYSHARDIPDSAILQQVMLGRLSVRFTQQAHPVLVRLGRECIDLNPQVRPTAAQVLHRVHEALQAKK